MARSTSSTGRDGSEDAIPFRAKGQHCRTTEPADEYSLSVLAIPFHSTVVEEMFEISG